MPSMPPSPNWPKPLIAIACYFSMKCHVHPINPLLLMKNEAQSDRKNDQTSGLVPNNRDLVWVQCKGYRCLACSDATGKWINFYTGKKLTDFVKIIR
jgi:hypothetical protein